MYALYLCVMPLDDRSKTFSLLCQTGRVSVALGVIADAGSSSSPSLSMTSGSVSAFLFPMLQAPDKLLYRYETKLVLW